MTEAALDGQENERKRIAADLHDSLGSLLWGAKLNAAYLERSVRLEGESRNAFDMLLTSLDQSVESIRRIALDSTPEAFNSVGLSESVRQLCEKLNGKGTEVVFSCTRDEWMFNDKRALSAYRIIQELIVNSLKHSKAANIRVSIAPQQTHVLVKVIDDGTGFELNGKRDGVGWWNIQQRATQLRAHIELAVPPQGTGSEVSLTIPLNE